MSLSGLEKLHTAAHNAATTVESLSQSMQRFAIAIGAGRISIVCDACDGRREVEGFSGLRPCALCREVYLRPSTYQIGGPC